MEIPTTWFITFEEKRIAEELEVVDTFTYGDKLYQMSPCDRRKLRLRVSWLPLWSDDCEVGRQLTMFAEVKRVEKERINGL